MQAFIRKPRNNHRSLLLMLYMSVTINIIRIVRLFNSIQQSKSNTTHQGNPATFQPVSIRVFDPVGVKSIKSSDVSQSQVNMKPKGSAICVVGHKGLTYIYTTLIYLKFGNAVPTRFRGDCQILDIPLAGKSSEPVKEKRFLEACLQETITSWGAVEGNNVFLESCDFPRRAPGAVKTPSTIAICSTTTTNV